MRAQLEGAGTLYSPFALAGTPARFVDVPRLALFQGVTDNAWLGACTELARARRIEWVLANQDNAPCFQPCDAYGGHSVATADVPPKPQVDGIVGAGTLAGTNLRLDYPARPSRRVIASCEAGSARDVCWAAPSCPGLSDKNKLYECFGQVERKWAPVCQ